MDDPAMVPTLRDVAEDAFAYIDGPGIEFDRRAELVLRNLPSPHPLFGMVLRPRLEDVDAGIAYARAWFGERGRGAYSWFVADSSQPGDLADRLAAAGAIPDPDDPVYAGMVLERAPDPVAGIEVRKVATFDEHCGAVELTWRSFGFSEEQKAKLRPKLRTRWEQFRGQDPSDRFIALVDGEIVGSGSAAYLAGCVYLLGGNVTEAARGRGVYRALVRARWDEAVARGTPALVVQAGQMSRPILERLGFDTVCTVRTFLDACA
jgi:acetyltransferase (GNAT) family protein